MSKTSFLWNQGAGSQVNVLKAMGITEPGVNTLQLLRNDNRKRISDAQRKCKSSYRKRRKILRHEKKKGTKTEEHYKSGAFSSSTPVKERSGKKRSRANVDRLTEGEIVVQFINEDDVIVSIHAVKKRRGSQ